MSSTRKTVRNTSTGTGHQNPMVIIGLVVGIVIVGAVVVLALTGGSNSSGPKNYSDVDQGRTEDGAFILGDPDAPITMVAFEDFLCSHCQAYKETVDRFIEDFVFTGQARFEYRFFVSIDPTVSPRAAKMTECSDTLSPGAFWTAHDIMYELTSSEQYSERTERKFADRLGLNYNDLLSCIPTVDQISTDRALGSRLGAQGTPAIMIRYGDGEPDWINYQGRTYDRGAVAYDVLAAVVEAAQ